MSGDLAAATVRARVPLPMDSGGAAEMCTFRGLLDGREHIALCFEPDPEAAGGGARAGIATGSASPTLVRVHSECLTGDVFGSRRCDCGSQLSEAIEEMSQRGGVLLYLRQEGRGIGLYNKVDAYALQDQGLDTFEANVAVGREEDERDYRVAVQMLRALGVEQIELLTNNPEKLEALQALGIETTRVGTTVFAVPENVQYLEDKQRIAGHEFDVDPSEAPLTQA